MEQKTFCAILESFSTNPQKAKNSLSDKRMTALEKAIVEGYLLMRDNKNSAIIELMNSFSGKPSEFVQAQKDLLLGIAYNNLNQYRLSIVNLSKAMAVFEKQFPYFTFIAAMNLFVVYKNGKDRKHMKIMLNKIKSYCSDNATDRARVARCIFNYYCFIEDFAQAELALEELTPLMPALPESEVISHLLNLFTYHVKTENFTACEEDIRRMKNHRKFNVSANFNFCRKLLQHYLTNQAIYLVNEDYESTPVLFHQLKVIQKFEEKDVVQAKAHWQILSELHPEIYAENFSYLGDKSIFSLCLRKYETLLNCKKSVAIAETGGDNLQKLYQFFLSHQLPLTKDELFEHVWDHPARDKEDYRKLSRTIVRLKQKFGIDIKARRGCYTLVTPAVKKAS